MTCRVFCYCRTDKKSGIIRQTSLFSSNPLKKSKIRFWNIIFNNYLNVTYALCRDVQYIERDGREHFHTLSLYPEDLQKKVTLLKYFRNYMSEHLLKVGSQSLFL